LYTGVGKGTYASRASKVLNIPHLAAGDLIRAEIKSNSALGKEMQKYTSNGKLVPDDIVNEIIMCNLRRHEHTGMYLWIVCLIQILTI
jgi:adenylate kinase